MVVREWDLGKEDGQQHMKEKDREKKDHDKKRRQRSRSPAVEAHLPAPARKFKKKEDEPPPAKLLDDRSDIGETIVSDKRYIYKYLIMV